MNVGRLIGESLERVPGVGGAVGWVRGRLRQGRLQRRHLRDGGPDCRYQTWVRADTPSVAQLRDLRAKAAALRVRPTISLVMPLVAPDARLLDRAITSIRSQIYPEWEVRIAHAGLPQAAAAVLARHGAEESRVKTQRIAAHAPVAVACNAALATASGDFVLVMGEADMLPPAALLRIAEAVETRPQVGIVYGDEDRVDGSGRRHDPWFKCDFNPELLLAHDALSRPTAFARRILYEVGGWRDGFSHAEHYDLALRASAVAGADGIVHVPGILYHRGRPAAEDAATSRAGAEAGRLAVAELLRREGRVAWVEGSPEAPACNRIRHALPADLPQVSMIICTRDNERLLRNAVDSIIARTTYPRYEIVIIDNGSVDPRAVALLAELADRPRIRVLRDDSAFNYSRLNNRAAAAARGEILCLLNDDIEVLTPDWLEELVSFAVQPDVGAVGARLWYPDGTLQHGGVVLGICRGAGHAHPRLPRGDTGYFGRAVLQQELSAVTGACLVVRAETFAAVAGLDETLVVAFNDVDFCLRLRQAGYRNVWTPFAELIHHESASRGTDVTPAKRARAERERAVLAERWGDALLRDPFYNPNLSPTAADFSVDIPSRWRRVAA